MVGAFGDMVYQVPLWLRTPQKNPTPSLLPPSVLQLYPALISFMFLQRMSTEDSSAAASKAAKRYPKFLQTVSVFWYSWGYGPFEENCLNYSIWKHDHLPYFFSEHPSSHRSSGSITFHSCWAHPEAFHLMAALKQTS